MTERFSLKDHLFNKKSVTYFADLFYMRDHSFPKEKFVKKILKDFPDLELKERIVRIRQELEKVLSSDYQEALATILQALPPELDPTKTDDDFGEFILAPLGNFIAINGCIPEHLTLSLNALRECTKRFSVEHDIRYFINAFPKETFDFLQKGAQSKNYHVRRLSSEGLRPTLPWSMNIDLDYKIPIEILDQLFSDRTRYVTRSVANHMNDISKIDPNLVIAKLSQWQQSGTQDSKEMEFIMNHSLRTLIKKGNKDALELLGYPPQPKIVIKNFDLKSQIVMIGENLEFSCDIVSLVSQKLMIDYAVHHKLASGKTNPKVFKTKKGSFEKGEIITIHKKQPFRIMTTKKLYPGIHRMELQINGVRYSLGSFNLVEAS